MSGRAPFAGMGLAVAAAALLSMPGQPPEPRFENYIERARKGKAKAKVGRPTKKRAKVKAARKANLKRQRS